jgi:hypothetical protein
VDRDELKAWVVEALQELGGAGSVLDVSKVVWRRHRAELESSDRLLYTWQYDLRWAATKLRREGRLAENARNEPWALID